MSVERLDVAERLEALKPTLGRFFEERVYQWGLAPEDCRLVGEPSFGYAGIPILGPKLLSDPPHIDIAVEWSKYEGPKGGVQRSGRIVLPSTPTYFIEDQDMETGAYEIAKQYGLAVPDFLIGSKALFAVPTLTIRMGNVDVLVPEPAGNVRVFANETILRYSEEEVGQHKLREWFQTLGLIRDSAQERFRPDVQEAAEKAIRKSRKRGEKLAWAWLSEEGAEIASKDSVTINWRGSNDVVARFIRKTYDEETIDRDFLRELLAVSRGDIGGFVHDVGHPGRGMDDFPFEIVLKTPKTQETSVLSLTKRSGLRVEMLASELVNQVANEIDRYGHTHRWGYNVIFEEKVKYLRALATRIRDAKIRVDFRPDYEEGRYLIESINPIQEQ